MTIRYKLMAVGIVLITTIISPFLLWFKFLDVITDGYMGEAVIKLWDREGV